MVKKSLLDKLICFAITGMFFLNVQAQTLNKRDSTKAAASDSLILKDKNTGHTSLNEDSNMMKIDLDEVFLVGALRFKSRLERRRYLILKYKTKKVWPYAVLAANHLTKLDRRLSSIKSGYKKRKYIRIVQHYIQDEFTDQLKKLTKTEGQILVKLMYRQTGETTFDIVKELKSGWRAFWYNTTASLFNISLKEKYDPAEVKEDYLIEHILRRAFQRNELKKQEAKIQIDFATAMEKWK